MRADGERLEQQVAVAAHRIRHELLMTLGIADASPLSLLRLAHATETAAAETADLGKS